MKSKIKVGDKVWYYEYWSGQIECGVVTELKDDVATVKSSIIGTSEMRCERLFLSETACIEAARAKLQERVDEYKAEITDIAALIQFPLNHTFGAEEYTDYEAIRAYEERATELGFNVIEK